MDGFVGGDSTTQPIDSNSTVFDASQYAFFGNDVVEEVELGGLEDEEEDEIEYDPAAAVDDEVQQLDRDERSVLGFLPEVDGLDVFSKVWSINGPMPQRDFSARDISSIFPIYYGDSRDGGLLDDWLHKNFKAIKRFEVNKLTYPGKRKDHEMSMTGAYLVAFGDYIKVNDELEDPVSLEDLEIISKDYVRKGDSITSPNRGKGIQQRELKKLERMTCH